MENKQDRVTRVGVIGAGAMGRGIAFQVAATAGMELTWVADIDLHAAECAVNAAGQGMARGINESCDFSILLDECKIDVLVEATNSIGAAADYCMQAIRAKSHVVLMNAEVDLALRPLLESLAEEHDVCVTSDAGDQHGVLAVMIEEADTMGFDVVQAGNIKGFLDQSATPESIAQEAAKRKLSATQCCAYTDGTKLEIEMAMLANAYGYLPPEGGMTGPRAGNVHEALDKFDFESYGDIPRIEYILGAEPGGGVYLIVKPKRDLPPEQAFYLSYYKLGHGPYYLLYRPYHLCHLETPKAINRAVSGDVLLAFRKKNCEVYAYAKRDIEVGDRIDHAIGSAECYGIVEPVNEERVPILLLEHEVVMKNTVKRGEALLWSDVDMGSSDLLAYWKKQEVLMSELHG